jgi:hypothetical protein
VNVEWARPWALWGLALAVPVVLASLYRRRRRRVVVPFLPLLQESLGGAHASLGWRRASEGLSLAARCLALGAVVVALAGPRPATAAEPPEALVLVLDADVTTTTEEGGGESRFARQVALGKAHVLARRGGPVAVVLAAEAPQVALAPTEDREAALTALARARPAEGTVPLGPALAAARDVAARLPRPRVVVLTSRALPDVAPGSNPVPIEALGAGIASDDQGFVDQSVTPADERRPALLRVVVANFATEPRTRTVVVEWEGASGTTERRRADVEVPARGTGEASVELAPGRAGSLVRARLEGEDAFAGNDATAAWAAPLRRPSVLVVHDGAPRSFVTAVLDAMGEGIDRDRSGAVRAQDLASAQPRDVTIVDGAPLLAGAGLRGPTLWLAPLSGAGLPFAVGDAVREPLVWRARADHPLLRGVDLSTAFVARATPIAGEGVRGLAFAESATVVAEGGTADAPWIAFGLDPEGSDLPLRAALPVLVKNAVRLLGARPDDPVRPFYRAGEPVLPRAGVDPAGWSVEWSRAAAGTAEARASAESVPRSSEAAGTVAPAGGPHEAWLVSPAGERHPVVTVDLDPARDPTPVRAASPPPPPAPPSTDPEPPLRRLLLLGAAALLVADLLFLRASRARGPRPKGAFAGVPAPG